MRLGIGWELLCQKSGTEERTCLSFATTGINLNSSTSTSMRERFQAAKEVGCSCGVQIILHRLKSLFFCGSTTTRQKEQLRNFIAETSSMRCKQLRASWMFESFASAGFKRIQSNPAEIIEEIIRDTGSSRYLVKVLKDARAWRHDVVDYRVRSFQ